MSASTSTSTSALPTLRPALRQLPSSVRTAGPQPGTFPAQCAPLDLNLGPSQLSAHRWTSTWDLPSSVRTAGPQPGTFPAQCAPLDLNGQIECQKICQIECQIECQKICQIKCQIECQKVCQIECQNDMPDRMLEDMPDRYCQKVCQIECQIGMPESMPDRSARMFAR